MQPTVLQQVSVSVRARFCARAWGISSSVPPLHISVVHVVKSCAAPLRPLRAQLRAPSILQPTLLSLNFPSRRCWSRKTPEPLFWRESLPVSFWSGSNAWHSARSLTSFFPMWSLTCYNTKISRCSDSRWDAVFAFWMCGSWRSAHRPKHPKC